MAEADQFLLQQEVAREFTFPGDLNSLVFARDSLMAAVREYSLTESEEIDVLIALQEALANAILHGCQNDPAKTIRCRAEICGSTLTIVIRDPGPGFDVSALDSATPANTTSHGRGICLMRSLMDEVSYRHGGSEVRLKRLLKSSR